MAIFAGLIVWVEAILTAYGLLGMFAISFAEAVIFPVPTAFFIAPMAAFGIDPFIITIVATIASVMGAFVGYGLGRYLGLPVANRLFGKYMPRVQKYFDRWGAWAVFIAAFTPVPFKVFTWASGIFRVDLRKFALACVAGRFLQFAIAAYAGSLLGPWAIIFLGGI